MSGTPGQDSWMWLALASVGFGLCAMLPVWIRDDELLKKVSWWLLVPVSVAILIYVYPAGIEVFRRLAIGR